MALIKDLTRFNVTANYLKLTRIDQFDRLTRQAVFIFSLYKDKATSRLPYGDPQGEPIVAIAAKLKLQGDAFDLYFAKGVAAGNNIEKQAYVAARAQPVYSWGPGTLDLTTAVDDLLD